MPFELARPRDPGTRHDQATLSFHKRDGADATVVLSMNKHFQDEYFGGVLIGGGAYVLVGRGPDRGKVMIGLCTMRDDDYPVPILANGPKASAKVCLAPWDGLAGAAVRASACAIELVKDLGEGAWCVEARLPASALRLPSVKVEFLPGDEVVPKHSEPMPEPEHASALGELPEAETEDTDAAEAERDAKDLALIAGNYGPKGPWPDALFASLRSQFEDGALIKDLAELIGANYQAFSREFAAYRRDISQPDAEQEQVKKAIQSAPRKSGLPPTPKPTLRDPDPERALSGWSIKDDIELMESFGTGLPAKIVAERINKRGGQLVLIEDVIERFKVLCPDPTAQRQGVVIGQLRKLQAAADAKVAAE